MKTNRIEIIISGIGGQGVVYSANLLGRAALYQHKFSSSIAHYGPESRGSVTTSEVVISNPTTPLVPLNTFATLSASKGGTRLRRGYGGQVKGGCSPLTLRTLTCLRAGTHRQAGSQSDLPDGKGQAGNPERAKGEGSCLDYPCVESPDIFIAMHQKVYDEYIAKQKLPLTNLKYLVYDSSLVTINSEFITHNSELIAVPASQLAKEELKNIMMANIILTASVVKATGIITRKNLERALKQMAPLRQRRICPLRRPVWAAQKDSEASRRHRVAGRRLHPTKDYQLNLQAIELGYREI